MKKQGAVQHTLLPYWGGTTQIPKEIIKYVERLLVFNPQWAVEPQNKTIIVKKIASPDKLFVFVSF